MVFFHTFLYVMTLINSEYGKRGGSEMLQVIKRDGTKVPFDKHKIAVAILCLSKGTFR